MSASLHLAEGALANVLADHVVPNAPRLRPILAGASLLRQLVSALGPLSRSCCCIGFNQLAAVDTLHEACVPRSAIVVDC